MQTVSYSPSFVRALTLCRYAVYLLLAVLTGLAALRRGQEIGPWLAYFFIAPLLAHLVLGRLRPRAAHVAVFVAEWGCTFAVVLACGLSAVANLAVAAIFLASNTALWGWRMLPLLALTGLLAGGTVFAAGLEQRIYTDLVLDSLGGLSAFTYLLAVCGVANAQANRLVRAGRTLKLEKRALLRYLPRDVTLGAAGIRRVWLTIAFVDLTGFTRATRELPDETLIVLLNGFLDSVNALVEQWDGSIGKFLGDGVLCVFPSAAAEARANAAAQAVRCLAQLPAVLAELNRQWRERGYVYEFAATVGVASGYCCVGDWGGADRADYTVIGVPVNLAARLQGEAHGLGGMLLDETTARLVADATSLAAPVSVDLKGIGRLDAVPLAQTG